MPTTRTEPETLRTNDVLARLNVSRSSLHRRRQNGTFPKPFQLGKHAVGWRLVSGGREPPPPALLEPYVTVSRHTAPTVRRGVEARRCQ